MLLINLAKATLVNDLDKDDDLMKYTKDDIHMY